VIKYETIEALPLSSSDTILRSSNDMPELVHLDDPAFTVMVDFCQTPAFTLKDTTNMRDAQYEMEFHGTHFMLVVNGDNHIKGLLTSEDLLGQKPIKVVQENRVSRDKVLVKMLFIKLMANVTI